MKQKIPEKPQQTLRKRLLIFLLPAMAVLLIFSLAADYRIAFDPADEAYDHALLDDAFALAGRVKFHDNKIEMDFPAAAEAVLRNDSLDQEFLAVYLPDGQLLTGDADLQPAAVVAGQSPVLSNDTLRGLKIRKASYRMEMDQGGVTITVAETTHKRERTGSRILAAMIIPNVLLILATLGLVYLGVTRGLSPLTELSDEISHRTPHDLSPLTKRKVPGEAEPLVKAMAALIDDLREAATAQQSFLANAAHQLKTPLAALQTQLELTVAEIPQEYRFRIGRLRDATQRLGHLAHQLLALARSGADANISHEQHRVNLGQLLEKNASAWFDAALARNIDLGFEPESALIEGSEWLLRELVANLIDNALQYTPSGGQVTARSAVDENNHPFIEVEDNGPGIPEVERHRVFGRFYRADSAQGAGTGLGLSIVKEVADRHNATISLSDASPAGGTRVRVVFPPCTKRIESPQA